MKSLAIFVRLIVGSWLLVGLSLPVAAQGASSLTERALLELNLDWSLSHQGSPMGVPKEYSWAAKPYLEAGNQPGKFTTMTGWGHVFWNKETLGHPGPLEIRNFHTFICGGADKRWEHAQHGRIEGAEFRADFQGNAAKRPAKLVFDGGTAAVLFDAGATFHFWPARGRIRLPGGNLCGVVVLLEARAAQPAANASTQSGGYLIGLGADYWIDMTAPWDNFKTNKGVGLGRLRQVGSEWAWYGMSTASNQDLLRLHASGLLTTAR